MKTALLTIGLALATCTPGWAVVTVRLNNIDCGYPVSFYEDPFLDWGTARVELFYAFAGGADMRVYSAGTQNSVFTVDKNGFFDGGIGVLPEVDPSWSVNFTLRAWEGGPNDIYAPIQNMARWTQTGFISWDPESGQPANGTVLNIPPMISAPEPSTFVLAILGGTFLAARTAYKKRRSPIA